MAKKSKAKKRKQSQNKSQNKSKTSAVKSQSRVNEPAKSSTKPEVEISAANEEHDLDEMMNEAVPRQPVQQKWIIVALVAMVALLGVVLLVMYQKTNDLKQNTTNTGQEQLLNVHESDGNSLQPTAPINSSTTPQGSSNPQDTTGGASDLQPQQSPTPDQLNQAQ